METIMKIRWIISFGLICLFTVATAQESQKKSIGDEVYAEYQQNGVDSAIQKYEKLKTDTSRYDVNEWELNRIAYTIMNDDGDLESAEKIFRLNMEEYPKAANPYDSYGDYLLEKGDKEGAKEYFRKSIKISEKSDLEQDKQLMGASKGKLAKLEDKDKQLNFLVGDWEVNSVAYDNGKEVQRMKGRDKIEYNENANALFVHHANEKNESEGVRIIAFDAVDDEFDVAYLNPHSLQGIQTSKMKMKKVGDNQYEFMDKYTTRSGKEMDMKHEIKKLPNQEVEWVIFEKDDKAQWQKVYAMNMKK